MVATPIRLGAALLIAVAASACSTDSKVLKGAGVGAAGGAVVGAVVPGVSTVEGAAIGAAGGAVTGAIKESDEKRDRRRADCQQRYPTDSDAYRRCVNND